MTVEAADKRHLAHLEAMGRKFSTLRSYRNQFEAQLTPRLGGAPIAALDREQVEQLVAALAREGLEPETIRNVVGLLNGICEFAVRRRWARENPCRYVDLPHVELREDIRFLEPDEVEAVLRAR